MATMNLMVKMIKVNFDCQLYNESIKMSNNYMQIVDKRHNKRTFTQPQTISRHLLCSICSDVFDDPVRTLCGHTFCYICIQNWSLIKTKCPLCNENFQKRKLEKDLLAAALVDDLNVKCFHQGCNWEGVESLRKKHQRTCDFRPRKDIEVVQNAVEVSDYQDVYEVSHFDLTSSPNEP